MITRHAASSGADSGYTLSEMLVVLVLLGIVGAIVTTASVTGLHHEGDLQDRTDATSQARTALERVDRDIRSTYPLLAASPTQIVLQEVQPTVTKTVTYAVSGSQLTVSTTSTPSGGGTATSSSSVLLRNLVNTAATPVFTVTPYSGYVAPSGSGVNASTCAMTATSYDPGCVGTITVHVMVQPPTVSGPVSVSDSGTELRNAA
jgi:prepilin-type N-terminal cleavage/methylation domain-containing protein